MQLVIVESPTKAKKIRHILGDDFVVEASRGHVRDLPKSALGVDPDQDFAVQYEVLRGSGKIVSALKSLAKKADKLFLATDPDREGEAIAWHLLEAWDDDALRKKSHRSVFHEITPEAVKEAIAQPGKISGDLVDAQQARRVLDRLVGYKLSPLLWKKVRRGLSAGRVQSVALRLIVEREAEIAAFVPQEYWEVDLVLVLASGAVLTARVMTVGGETYEPKSAADVERVTSWAPQAKYAITGVESKQRSRKPYAPFTTSTLQQAAANRLGMSAKRTMQLAQQLYELGHITYHRTDATTLSAHALDMARAYIAKTFGSAYLPAEPQLYAKQSKNAQEAHEAIRPTAPLAQLPEEGKLTASHLKLYDLIFRRFVASQMTPAVSDITTVTITGSQDKRALEARVTGSVMKHDGWMRLFPGSEDTILPAVAEGEALRWQDVQTAQKFTQPPPRFNDASLVKELEKRGIGRPSTYASIISVILDRGYVERLNKAFVPTAIGTTVAQFLVKNFAEIVDYDFTARMEDELDEIALGHKEWRAVMRTFFGPFAKKLGAVEKTAERMTVPVEPLRKPCPQCGVSEAEYAELIEKHHTLADRKPEDRTPAYLREQAHGELVVRVGRFGKFISCSRYPECDYTEKFVETLDIPCPQCAEGEVVIKKTKKGRTFYGCSRYPECDYASWSKPQSEGSSQDV